MTEYVVQLWRADLKHTIILNGAGLDKLAESLTATDASEWIQMEGVVDDATRSALHLCIRKSEIASWCYWECK